ncbi:hypothetical protein [Longimicrobium terrae]|uniref:Uncharacterized protein n=1 Tax=Longimicrobium terrae TaxID=1639882 RepID=A0A841H4J8_9BACT|nr:hypothetical protein [Longimicrobium terrae]MBB4638701.1 hypothetical protein [Longimicrobium terrae]MBB6072940.1 hypothetical protein [Longimicrobium terrae]NNC31552.1 hypothetical protein [Longimicrobium terrae]
MPRRTAIRFTALMACTCLYTACVPGLHREPRTPQQDERDVLLAAIRSLEIEAEHDPVTDQVVGEHRVPVVLLATTRSVDPALMPGRETLRRERVRLPAEALSDLVRRSAAPVPIVSLTGDSLRARVITAVQLDSLRNAPGGVNAPGHLLNLRYPQARGVHLISRPGFDPSRTHAAVSVGLWCGNQCGTGGLLLLDFHRGRWRVLRYVGMTIA